MVVPLEGGDSLSLRTFPPQRRVPPRFPLSGHFLVAFAISTFVGCFDQGDRPDLGEVTGVVTLDGEPLADASIAFTKEGFRPSVGHTNSEGKYELIYIRDTKGAAVGTHRVRIRQFGRQGRVPARYDVESELTGEVKPGENVINFELVSEP